MRKKAFIIILSAIAILGASPFLIALALSQYFHITFDRCIFDYLNKVHGVNLKPIFGMLNSIFFLLLCGIVIGSVVMWIVGAVKKNVKMKIVCKELLLSAFVGLLLSLVVEVGILYIFFGCIVDIS